MRLVASASNIVVYPDVPNYHPYDMKVTPELCSEVFTYIQNPAEKANEFLLLRYFYRMFPDDFDRQENAHHSDGYVPGRFVLELKSDPEDWLEGLCQGIAYGRNGLLDFPLVVVAAGEFLVVWHMRSLPQDVVAHVIMQTEAANEVGKICARHFRRRSKELLGCAMWRLALPAAEDSVKRKHLKKSLEELASLLVGQTAQRLSIGLESFPTVIEHLKPYFDPRKPAAPVRAFYSLLPHWYPPNTLQIDPNNADCASYAGVQICNLVPGKRQQLKSLLDKYQMPSGQSSDDFFSRYDIALNAVAPEFRDLNGVYFTQPDLAKFAIWWAGKHLPRLGEDYLVIDPACGSGNLIASWRSPMKMRHKVLSDLDPELVYAVQERLRGDPWHGGRFTIISESPTCQTLNFLNLRAADYLSKVTDALRKKKLRANKPLAFLCNPPYRNDDDRPTSTGVEYEIDDAIKAVTGKDLASERYCCFIAQMMLVCEKAEDIGIPENSVLLLFTQTSWFTNRPVYRDFRRRFLKSFTCMGGFLVTAGEFFDGTGRWPLAFTAWKYAPDPARIEEFPSINLIDLTMLKRQALGDIPWQDEQAASAQCHKIVSDPHCHVVDLGFAPLRMHEWSETTTVDFKRDRRKTEAPAPAPVGGLPAGDARVKNKKAYGDANGEYVGYMDDLTPVRVRRNPNPGRPWFRLNSLFMDCRKTRCFSAPPDQKGFSSSDDERMVRLFAWYSIARTVSVREYPLWANTLEMWAINLDSLRPSVRKDLLALISAIVYATNECISVVYPADNPMKGLPELCVSNAMSPLGNNPFWKAWIKTQMPEASASSAAALVQATDLVFAEWKRIMGKAKVLHVPHEAPYFLGAPVLLPDSGLVQIQAYERACDDSCLRDALANVQEILGGAYDAFHTLLMEKDGINYFGGREHLLASKPTFGVKKVVRVKASPKKAG